MGFSDIFLDRKGKALIDKNVRLRTIGDLSGFPLNIQKKVIELVELSTANTGINLTVALNYGGQADLVLAAQSMMSKIAAEDLDMLILTSKPSSSISMPLNYRRWIC